MSAFGSKIALVFLASVIIHFISIKLAQRTAMVAQPDRRRRHQRPTAVVGGVCLFSAWAASLYFYLPHFFTMLPLLLSIAAMVGLGLWDDMKSLKPRTKLMLQALIAIFLISSQPEIRLFAAEWQPKLGFAIWPLMLTWVLGITNAFNLIDGLDGLAGGVTFLTLGSLLMIRVAAYGFIDDFALAMILLLPSVCGFLFFNWNPAKVFLGDNGSLGLGLFVSASCFIPNPSGQGQWSDVCYMAVGLAYPILDMGLAVTRRKRAGLGLLTADRSHLHHRLLRMGFSVRQTTLTLMGVVALLEVSAAAMAWKSAVISWAWVALQALVLYFSLAWLSKQERANIAKVANLPAHHEGEGARPLLSSELLMSIELTPLFEAALLEERSRYKQVIEDLVQRLRCGLWEKDALFLNEKSISILFAEPTSGARNKEQLRKKYLTQLDQFFDEIDLQCSLSSLPIHFDVAKSGRKKTEITKEKNSA
jgi:UDP-GlcNAc:undecaprenyl-phosphate GlcNAc-1-phosphate transferase